MTRLWSLHPKYLDCKGLVAVWREGLGALTILRDGKKGYSHHPQLDRFKQTDNPAQTISDYLHHICDEADNRGYKFDRSKLGVRGKSVMFVNKGQMKYEHGHLYGKLEKRSPDLLINIMIDELESHPTFSVVEGDIEEWEKV